MRKRLGLIVFSMSILLIACPDDEESNISPTTDTGAPDAGVDGSADTGTGTDTGVGTDIGGGDTGMADTGGGGDDTGASDDTGVADDTGGGDDTGTVGDDMTDAGGGTGMVVINEVMPNPSSGEDWIELYNPGDGLIDLSGYWLSDDAPRFDLPDHVWEIPAGTTLGAGEYISFERNKDNAALGFEFGLGADGDSAILYDTTQTLVDTATWWPDFDTVCANPDLECHEDHSWGRIPNGSGEFKVLFAPTRDLENVDNMAVCPDGLVEGEEECDDDNETDADGCTACAVDDGWACSYDGLLSRSACHEIMCPDGLVDLGEECDDDDEVDDDGCTACVVDRGYKCDYDLELARSVCEAIPLVVINEVMFSDLDSGPDWIELYNADDEVVDLSGWQLVDFDTALDSADAFTFAEGTSLDPGEYLTVYQDPDDADALDFWFGLGGGGDEVNLYGAEGNRVDWVVWPPEAGYGVGFQTGMSFGRIPNGEGDFILLFMDTPSDGTAATPTMNGENVVVPFCGDGALNQEGEICDDANGQSGDGCDLCEFEMDWVCFSVDALGDSYPSVCYDLSNATGIVVNEAMAKDTSSGGAPGTGDDWIELYNWTEAPIVVVGLCLTDDKELIDVSAGACSSEIVCPDDNYTCSSDTTDEGVCIFADAFAIPEGTAALGAGEYLVFVKDATDSFTFGLGGGDAVFLYSSCTADAVLLDVLDWETLEDDSSFGRWPDGVSAYYPMINPSPGEDAGSWDYAGGVNEVCGQGVSTPVVEASEACDDGNNVAGDGCTALCQFEGDELCFFRRDTVDGFDAEQLLSLCFGETEYRDVGPIGYLNEVVEDPDAIELYGSVGSATPLGDWYLTDNMGDLGGDGVCDCTESVRDTCGDEGCLRFDADTEIGADEYLVYVGNADDSFTFDLDGGGDMVLLFDGDGVLMDWVQYGDGEAALSWSWCSITWREVAGFVSLGLANICS